MPTSVVGKRYRIDTVVSGDDGVFSCLDALENNLPFPTIFEPLDIVPVQRWIELTSDEF